ncbi:hypothetical protein [Marinobacter sp. BSs20148]|uniref:hypothetical protein n=1 Tax=Marinobacter sp. BSs20148 TaxID=490759 RepID=UPI001D0D24C2|nr:hypothetical protein [Marinobacter sp. BSs20148]
MPLSIVGMDIWGEDVENSELVFETGDSDGLCDFTGRPLMPVTWTSRPTARCRWTNCNTSMNF